MRPYHAHLKTNEKIILVLRRHPFIIFAKIFFWLMVALLPLIFHLTLEEVLAGLFNNNLFLPIVILFLSIYYLYLWLFIFHSFVDYYLDIWIVTDERIINIEQRGLFDRVVSEQKLYRVQDVTSELKGFFSTILNYGTVHIQTAGEEQRFIFEQVPDPYNVAKKIAQLAEEHKKIHHQVMEKEKNKP